MQIQTEYKILSALYANSDRKSTQLCCSLTSNDISKTKLNTSKLRVHEHMQQTIVNVSYGSTDE